MSKPVINHDFQKTSLRLPRQLHTALSELAERNGTSLNAEILARLLQMPLEERLERVDRRAEDIESITKQILAAVRAIK